VGVRSQLSWNESRGQQGGGAEEEKQLLLTLNYSLGSGMTIEGQDAGERAKVRNPELSPL